MNNKRRNEFTKMIEEEESKQENKTSTLLEDCRIEFKKTGDPFLERLWRNRQRSYKKD